MAEVKLLDISLLIFIVDQIELAIYTQQFPTRLIDVRHVHFE